MRQFRNSCVTNLKSHPTAQALPGRRASMPRERQRRQPTWFCGGAGRKLHLQRERQARVHRQLLESSGWESPSSNVESRRMCDETPMLTAFIAQGGSCARPAAVHAKMAVESVATGPAAGSQAYTHAGAQRHALRPASGHRSPCARHVGGLADGHGRRCASRTIAQARLNFAFEALAALVLLLQLA